jgi:GMP synthase (glutamine-hydrolysing)
VYEETKYPFLKDEGRLLRKAILEEMPILGICLGAQLLAKVCGAQITKAPQKEVGWGQVKLTKEGRQDSLFEGIDHELKVFQWHEDAFAIPEGGALLAENTLCPGKGKYNFLTTSKIAESHRRSRLWRIPPKAGRRFFRNQAFRFGKNAYGLQFHFEVNPGMINSWVHRYAGESLSEIDTRDMFIEAHKAEVLFQRQAQALRLNCSRIIEGARKKAAA